MSRKTFPNFVTPTNWQVGDTVAMQINRLRDGASEYIAFPVDPAKTGRIAWLAIGHRR
ncbi:MAG: hypothetical protein WBL50_13925 [Candidatus Acidiferrum sp.]